MVHAVTTESSRWNCATFLIAYRPSPRASVARPRPEGLAALVGCCLQISRIAYAKEPPYARPVPELVEAVRRRTFSSQVEDLRRLTLAMGQDLLLGAARC